jgi:hypothetical protein
VGKILIRKGLSNGWGGKDLIRKGPSNGGGGKNLIRKAPSASISEILSQRLPYSVVSSRDPKGGRATCMSLTDIVAWPLIRFLKENTRVRMMLQSARQYLSHMD